MCHNDRGYKIGWDCEELTYQTAPTLQRATHLAKHYNPTVLYPLLCTGFYLLILKRKYMECPFCNAEMSDCGAWGYLAAHQSGEVLGHTFKCPNAEGFEDEEAANAYLLQESETLDSLGLSSWEELTCPSSMHHVSGSFYTDKQENLHEGYPC